LTPVSVLVLDDSSSFTKNHGESSVIFLDSLGSYFPNRSCVNISSHFINNLRLNGARMMNCNTFPVKVIPTQGETILSWPGRILKNISLFVVGADNQPSNYPISNISFVVGKVGVHSIMVNTATSPRFDRYRSLIAVDSAQFIPYFQKLFSPFTVPLTFSVMAAKAEIELKLVGCPPGWLTEIRDSLPFLRPDSDVIFCQDCPPGSYNVDGGKECYRCIGEVLTEGESQSVRECLDGRHSIGPNYTFVKYSGFYIPFSEVTDHSNDTDKLKALTLLSCVNRNGACMEQNCTIDSESYVKEPPGWKIFPSNCTAPCKTGHTGFLCSDCICEDKSACNFKIGTHCFPCRESHESEFWLWFPLVIRIFLVLILILGVNLWQSQQVMEIALIFVLFFIGLAPGSTMMLVAAFAIIRVSVHVGGSKNNDLQHENNDDMSSDGVFKILLYFWQTTLTLNSDIWDSLHEAFIDTFRKFRLGGPVLSFFLGTKCLSVLVFPSGVELSPLADYFISILAPSSVLFLLLFARIFIQRICNCCKKKKALATSVEEHVTAKDEVLSLLVFVVYANYFEVLQETLAVFDCESQYHFSYLSDRPYIPCSTSDPRYFALRLAAIVVLVVLILLLLGMGSFLFYYFFFNGKEKAVWPHWSAFWVEGYKPKLAYFEFFWSLRRVLLACTMVLGGQIIEDRSVVSSLLTALILLWNLIVLKWTPFSNSRESLLDVLASGLIVVTHVSSSRSSQSPQAWVIILAVAHVVLITVIFGLFLGKRCSCSCRSVIGSVDKTDDEILNQPLLDQLESRLNFNDMEDSGNDLLSEDQDTF
jgi:hypothetical protein